MTKSAFREVWQRFVRRSRPHKSAHFQLEYTPPRGRQVTVGHLFLEGGEWTFRYDPDYRGRHDLRPLEGFDDLSKVYRSKILFPFFAVRVPDEHRPDVRRRLEADGIEAPDTSDLLRIFGRRAAASPAFELVEKG
jgi:HipA-like protein